MVLITVYLLPGSSRPMSVVPCGPMGKTQVLPQTRGKVLALLLPTVWSRVKWRGGPH